MPILFAWIWDGELYFFVFSHSITKLMIFL